MLLPDQCERHNDILILDLRPRPVVTSIEALRHLEFSDLPFCFFHEAHLMSLPTKSGLNVSVEDTPT